jgi:hypothetical protein
VLVLKNRGAVPLTDCDVDFFDLLDREVVKEDTAMSSCERCWKAAGGDPDLYRNLVESSECTPEDQAGGANAGLCPVCGRRTVHMYTGRCMACNYRRGENSS